MSYESDIEFLRAYNEWVFELKSKGLDVSPEAYMLDKAKNEALSKLITVDEMLAKLPEALFDDVEIQAIVEFINT